MKKGFSLFELLVSISIIGILVALVSVSFSSAQKKARDARRVQDMNGIQKAAEQFYSNHNATYPDNNSWDAGDQWFDTAGGLILASFPSDPKQGQVNLAGFTYRYTATGATGATGYCIYVPLEELGVGNCSAACDFTGASGRDFYCISNQQ